MPKRRMKSKDILIIILALLVVFGIYFAANAALILAEQNIECWKRPFWECFGIKTNW